ncbi:hypothetical protein R5W24_003427 [Gemmata sp. JC717]|uniref:Uncharacterized protein n=1 Tax=Gemmata algarum TaxID=2975278 RepID=A0ABU5F6E4_9BACT|nr:hypothetical protein [Gemmata algarum]MDY3554307.1 hypothetical protein [Gemmata algarum]MDY3562703.1 hypothetical protein [Gemmata algarum]
MWYRVFGSSQTEPAPAALAEHLHAHGLAVEPHFRGDDLGWTEGELRLPGGAVVQLSRYLTKEDDLRDDLNAHAAELETVEGNPHATPLMERVIQTQQLITLRSAADGATDAVTERMLDEALRFLATATGGVYQIDGRGWYSSTGERLLQEP